MRNQADVGVDGNESMRSALVVTSDGGLKRSRESKLERNQPALCRRRSFRYVTRRTLSKHSESIGAETVDILRVAVWPPGLKQKGRSGVFQAYGQ